MAFDRYGGSFPQFLDQAVAGLFRKELPISVQDLYDEVEMDMPELDMEEDHDENVHVAGDHENDVHGDENNEEDVDDANVMEDEDEETDEEEEVRKNGDSPGKAGGDMEPAWGQASKESLSPKSSPLGTKVMDSSHKAFGKPGGNHKKGLGLILGGTKKSIDKKPNLKFKEVIVKQKPKSGHNGHKGGGRRQDDQVQPGAQKKSKLHERGPLFDARNGSQGALYSMSPVMTEFHVRETPMKIKSRRGRGQPLAEDDEIIPESPMK